MARRHRRLQRRRRRRHGGGGGSLLRKLGIAAALALPLLYFTFTVVFFDPFEEQAPAFPQLIPREVDLYVRRERLDTDFSTFPMPRELERLQLHPAWRTLTGTSWYQQLAWPAAVAEQSEQLSAQLAGVPLDPLADLAGRELVFVGRLAAAGAGAPRFAALSRISTRAKLAYELLGWESVLQRALPGAVQETLQDPQVPEVSYRRLDIPDAEPLFYTRMADLLVAGQNEVLVRDILRTAHGGAERSLGLSRFYRDQLPDADASPADHLDAEVFLNVAKLLAQTGAEEALEDTQRPDALANILDRLVDLTLAGEMACRFQLDGGDLALEGKADLDRTRVDKGRTGLVGAPPFDVRQRLAREMRLLPDDVSAVLTMNVDLRKFLGTVTGGFDPDLTRLLNSTLRGVARYSTTWKVENLPAMAAYLDRALEGEVTVVVRPLDHEVPPGAQPLPLIAVILRVRNLSLWEALDQAMIRGHRAMGLTKEQMWQQEEGVGVRKWIELAGFALEELSYIVLDGETLVIGTSDSFVGEIVGVYTSARYALNDRRDTRRLVDSLGGARGNLAGWAEARRLRALVEPYAEYLADDATRPDMVALRKRRKAELVARDFPAYRRQVHALPPEVEEEVEARLDELLTAEEERRMQVEVPAEAARWLGQFAWLDLLGGAAFGLRLGDVDAELALRVETVLSEGP